MNFLVRKFTKEATPMHASMTEGGSVFVMLSPEDLGKLLGGGRLHDCAEGGSLNVFAQLFPDPTGSRPSNFDSPDMDPRIQRNKVADAMQDKLSASMLGGFEDSPSADEVKPDAVTGGQNPLEQTCPATHHSGSGDFSLVCKKPCGHLGQHWDPGKMKFWHRAWENNPAS